MKTGGSIMVKLNLEYKKPVKLTFKTGNPKTDKNLKQEYNKYWILRLNLAPYTISGYNVCPSASKGCAESCLHTAGNPVFQKQKKRRESSWNQHSHRPLSLYRMA